MANTVNRQVNIYISSGEAQSALDALLKKQKALTDEIGKTTDTKRIAKLNQELGKLGEPIDRARKKLSGELAPTFRDLEAATRRWLNEFKRTGDPQALANFQKFNQALKQQKDIINDLDAGQKKLGEGSIFKAAFWANLAAKGIDLAVSSIKEFFSGAIDEALDAEKKTAKFKSTLDNLGKSTAFDRLTASAERLTRQFKYLDDADIIDVFTKLIDYGKLTEQQINQLLPVIIDFAAKTGTSIDEASSVIISALEGNGKALKQFGINIGDAKTTSERFNIVMTTLAEKVKGAGEAFQQTAEGGIAAANAEFKKMKEDVGTELIPVLSTLLGWADKLLKGFKYLGEQVAATFSDIGAFIDGGPAAAAANKAARELDKQNKITQEIVDNLVTSLSGKSTLEVGEKINELNNLLVERTRFLESAKKNVSGVFTDEDVKKAETGIKLLRAELSALYKLQADAGQSLGITMNNTSNDVKNVVKQVKELDDLLDKLRNQKVSLLPEGYKTDEEKALEAAKQLQQKIADDQANIINETVKRNAQILESTYKSVNADRLAAAQLNLLKATGKQRLKAELDLLKEEEAQELQQKDLTENQKQLIEEKYRGKRKQAEMDYWMNIAQFIINSLGQALQVYNTYNQLQTDKENAELENYRRRNDEKTKILDNRLKKGLITQLQYDREVQKLQKEQEKREKEAQIKQFNRNKAASLASASLNAAGAVLTTLKEFGPPIAPNFLGIAAMAFTVLTNLANIGIIATSKPPKFARGGKLGGRSHKDGGNAIVDGSGRKIGEVEAGELITNKRTAADRNTYTVSGTPSQIISRLNALHGGVHWEGGAMLQPAWKTASTPSMNYARIRRGYYAQGGVVDTGNAQAVQAQQPDLTYLYNSVDNLTQVVNNLNMQLNRGIKAYTVLTENEIAQNRLNAIRADATLK